MTEVSPLRHRSARKFDAVLASHGLVQRVVELPASTRTAAEAAQAIGCELRQIVKSLVFLVGVAGTPVLVLASGANRVDEEWMARYAGGPLSRADPESVRSVSGYAIGGVPPIGHASPIPTYIDYDLLELPEVWAAAGHPNAVCRLSPRELLLTTRGHPVAVTRFNRPDSDHSRWVTFDCYGTLVDWRAGFFHAMDRLNIAESESEKDLLFRAYLQEEQNAEAGAYRSYREVMSNAFLRAAHHVGFELSDSRARELPESIQEWPLFPDAHEALTELRRHGTRIGVLSNIDRDLFEGTLSKHRLAFDTVVTAEDVRSYKPAPAHWVRFLKQTGVAPNTVTHVSSSFEYDIEVASALGFRTAFVSRYGPLPEGRDAGTVLRTLHGLSTSAPS